MSDKHIQNGNCKKSKRDRIYMDYNATTPLAPSVVDIVKETLTTSWGNPSSSYRTGVVAKEIIETARRRLLAMINGAESSEMTFNSGGTEANNHVIWIGLKHFENFHKSKQNSVAKQQQLPHFVTSSIEHDSILNVLKTLEGEGKAQVSYVGVSKELGCVDPNDIVAAITDQTVLVTLMMANNETGVIQV